jgi:3'(2'), 5'-bisphosphate nucleotidase
MEKSELLRRATEIAREAGAAIMAHCGGGAAVERKADDSPLTAADRAAHAIIVERLRELERKTPIISEEGEIPPFEARRGWERFWLVDPLDGTKEFLKRNGEFTVNIARIESGEPVLGVVYAPALGVLYCAAKGLGAWKEEAGRPPERIFSRRAAKGEALTIVESRSHPSAELEAFLRTIRVARRVAAGSSLKFCWLAEGKADLYPRFGPTMEWDVAAGDCIWRNSGREGERRSPLCYNTEDMRIARFVVGLEGDGDGRA